MGQSTFSIRLEDDIKNDMNSVCEYIGMSMSTAFNIFARAFVRNRGFPFDVKISDEKNRGTVSLKRDAYSRKGVL